MSGVPTAGESPATRSTGLDSASKSWICSPHAGTTIRSRPRAGRAGPDDARPTFPDVSYGCGERRVIAFGVMARDRKLATATLAHVALRITCRGCKTGPDEVHLCATIDGRNPPTFGGGVARQSA